MDLELSRPDRGVHDFREGVSQRSGTARAIAKDKEWFRHPGTDVRGPEKTRRSLLAHMRRVYVCDPAPTLRAFPAPLLAIFGELDTPEGVKAQVSAIRQIMDQAGRRDYTIKVYPNGSHNLMEVPPDNPNEYFRLKRFPPDLAMLISKHQRCEILSAFTTPRHQ